MVTSVVSKIVTPRIRSGASQPERIAGVFEAELQAERGHQEAEEHRAAVAHEDFGGLEIPAEEAGGAAEDRRGQRGDQCLAVEVGEHGEKDRCHGGDAGAETVHVVEDAEGSGDADDPERR